MNKEKTLNIIAGCNGSGKTTAFRQQLSSRLGNPPFINPDIIAKQIDLHHQWEVRNSAARCTIAKISENIDIGISFCVETTLASRSYINTIKKAHDNNYKVNLYYFWLESAELSVQRVHQRSLEGANNPNIDNHSIPEEDLRRRYPRSVNNLFNLYMPIVDSWELYDNSLGLALLIADSNQVYDNTMFDIIQKNDQETIVSSIDIEKLVNQIGILEFSESVLKDKMRRGESVVYSINGKIETFSSSDILWLYNNFHRDLDNWEIRFLKEQADLERDVYYPNGKHFPAKMVLKLWGIEV
jgi:predicted ABC-type ATPase